MTGDAAGLKASGALDVALVVNDGPELSAAAVLGCDVDDVAVCSTGMIGVRLPMDAVSAGVHLAVPQLAITTDASAAPATLDAALRTVTSRTFDRIDSDGCMSTNDAVIAMASGASGVMVGRDLEEEQFVELLDDVCRELARQLLAAVGTTDAAFDPNALTVSMNGVTVAAAGAAISGSVTVDLSSTEVRVEIDLAAGHAHGWAWTNDLTAAHVHENSSYSS